MADQQKPSVGRVVHYVAYGTPGGEFPAGVCRAAIVTEVETERVNDEDTCCFGKSTVGLCIMNPTGFFFNRHVHYDEGWLEPGGMGHSDVRTYEPGTWHWPERV